LKPVTHKMFRKNLVLQLVGTIRNKNVKKLGRNFDTEGIECLSGRHSMAKIPNGKAKDCAVCRDRKIKPKQTVYHCEACARLPGLHSDTSFKKYHTVKQYK